MTRRRIFFIIYATIIFSWIPLYLQGPLYFYDTTGYMRGPDYALHKLTGISSDWSLHVKETGHKNSSLNRIDNHNRLKETISAPEQQGTLSGRSIYYGAFIFTPYFFTGSYLSVFIQSVIVSIMIACAFRILKIKFDMYFFTLAILILAMTSLPVYTALLMPDIFAGVMIFVTAFFFCYWKSISKTERILLFILLMFSLLAHTSHLLTCIVMTAVLAALACTGRDRLLYYGKPLLLTGIAILIAISGNYAFSRTVEAVTGAAPIHPPFLAARVIADGPGTRYLTDTCPENNMVYCDFLDRLPMSSWAFLWERDPEKGVFATVDINTRRLLSEQQYRLAMESWTHLPIEQTAASLRNTAEQMVSFSFRDLYVENDTIEYFFYKAPNQLTEFLKSRADSINLILSWIGKTNLAITIFSIVLLLYAFTVKRREIENGDNNRGHFGFRGFCGMVFLGITINAAVCGALSSTNDRYQARVIWLVALLAVLAYGRIKRHRSRELSAGTSGTAGS